MLTRVGEVRRAQERLREAEAVAERLNDDRRRGRVCALMTNIHSLFGELDQALVTGTRALEIAGRIGDLKLGIHAMTALSQAHYYRGDYERVVELASDNLAALPADWVNENFGLSAPASVYQRYWLVMSLVQLGRFADAADYTAEAIQPAEATRHTYAVGLADNAACTVHLLKGDWAKARSAIGHWIAVAGRNRERSRVGLEPQPDDLDPPSAPHDGNYTYAGGNEVEYRRRPSLHVQQRRRAGGTWHRGQTQQLDILRSSVSWSAWLLAQLGEASEALNQIREAEQLLEFSMAKGIVGHRGWNYHSLGCASLLLGRLDEAQILGDRAVKSSLNHPGFAAHALHLLGDIATHPDRLDAENGESHYRQALALAEHRGMRPLIAHCHLGLGKLHRRTGNRGQAQEHLTTATVMYREMDMAYWLEQAAAEIQQLG